MATTKAADESTIQPAGEEAVYNETMFGPTSKPANEPTSVKQAEEPTSVKPAEEKAVLKWTPKVGESVLHSMELMKVESFVKAHPEYVHLIGGGIRTMAEWCVEATEPNIQWSQRMMTLHATLRKGCFHLNGSNIHSYFVQRWQDGLDGDETVKQQIEQRIIDFCANVIRHYYTRIDGVRLF